MYVLDRSTAEEPLLCAMSIRKASALPVLPWLLICAYTASQSNFLVLTYCLRLLHAAVLVSVAYHMFPQQDQVHSKTQQDPCSLFDLLCSATPRHIATHDPACFKRHNLNRQRLVNAFCFPRFALLCPSRSL